MTFKPRIWYPIAAALSVLNIIAVPFAVVPGEPLHATIHAALAVAAGLWAQRLRQRLRQGTEHARLDANEVFQVFEAELSQVRRELGEAQERLDFVERLMAQKPDPLPLRRER